jgi:hypothetical protein
LGVADVVWSSAGMVFSTWVNAALYARTPEQDAAAPGEA